MNWVSILFTLLFGVIQTCQGSEPVQICRVNSGLHTDMCLALKSVKSNLRGHDLLMTFSIKFHEGSGWAAFGVGDLMDRAVMFVLWPGEHDGDVILSLRSTIGHLAPMPLKNQRQIHVHSTEIDETGLHVLRATCYSCDAMGLGGLNATSERQPWLYAASYTQRTKTNDAHLPLEMHTDHGLKLVDMSRALSAKQEEHYPEVTSDRSMVFAKDSSVREGSASKRTSINIWEVHGSILAFSVNLNFLGIILIRSGLKWAFHGHWVMQALSACGLLAGCFIGASQSTNIFQVTTFASMHKMIGLAIAVAVPVQLTLGYKHHINFVKYGQRTVSSSFHIYLGRVLFIVLNLNVFMGLWHARSSITLRWIWAVSFLAETIAVSGLIFFKRTGNDQGYQSVEGEEIDPFTIGEDDEKWDGSSSRTR